MRKIYTCLSSVGIVFLFLLFLVFHIPKAEAATSGYYTYWVSNGKAAITECDTSISGNVTIPATLGGYPVTSIVSSAFYNCSSLTSITIPDSVTSIGEYAFSDCNNLTSITIPDSITSIGNAAFDGCSSLTSITIPDSITSIGNAVFNGCSSLTSITIPDSITSIGNSAFNGCSSLTSIEIPDSVTSIGSYVFYYCNNLTSITIPDSVTSIGNSAFCGCSSLTSITIPDSVTSIGSYVFYNCSSLTSIEIPDSVTSIGFSAFNGCSNLTSITIPDGITSINEYEFYGCSNLTSIEIPDSVTSIGFSAFNGCASLTSITIPDSIASVGDYAFSDCSSLAGITIPDSITSIGYNAFYNCSSLTSITIPDSITSIGFSAFGGCTSLTDVYYAGTGDQWQGISIGDWNSYLTRATIHYSHIHDYSLIPSITVEPTCTDAGYTEYTCVWGEKYREYIPLIEHNYSIKGLTIQPTCTSQGYTEYQCVQCGKMGQLNWVDALGHDYTGPEKTVKPTCTTSGSTGPSCTRCDAIRADQTFDALGHNMARVDAKEPTCTEAGNSVGTQCSRCQMYGVQPEIIAALGHLEVIEPAVPATCTNAGLTEGKYCSRCSEIFVAQMVENALGHYVLQGDKELVDSYSTQNDETYPFAVVDGWYESTNKDHKTTSIYTIFAVYDCTLVLKYKVSSESNYDKLQILVNSTTKDTISGSVSEKALSLTLKAGDRIYIKYAKDSSVSRNADTGYFKIDSCTQTEVDTIVRVSTDDIEPNCMQAVVCVDCNQIIKEAAEHNMENGVCTVCGCRPVNIGLTTVTLRPGVAGLYFSGSFDIAKDVEIARRGIVVSVYNQFPMADGTDPHSLCSEGTTSVLVTNILNEKYDDNSNAVRAAMSIYARAYVELSDGTYMYSDVVSVNLREVTEAADTQWSTLDDTQKAAITAMYFKFKTVLGTWNLTNIGSPSVEPVADVLIISDTQTISNQTIDTDVYITSTGVATFNNVTVNGNIYCYGQLNASGCVANDVYAYAYGSMMSCDAFDGTHGKVSGGISCNGLTIQDDALEYAFSKWGKQ